MKTTSTKTAELVNEIDKQLKMILENDILKIEDINVKNAVFLQLIAA